MSMEGEEECSQELVEVDEVQGEHASNNVDTSSCSSCTSVMSKFS